jgi:hypothetical protein
MDRKWAVVGLAVLAVAGCGSGSSKGHWSRADVRDLEQQLSSKAPLLMSGNRDCFVRGIEAKLSPDEIKHETARASRVAEATIKQCLRTWTPGLVAALEQDLKTESTKLTGITLRCAVGLATKRVTPGEIDTTEGTRALRAVGEQCAAQAIASGRYDPATHTFR